MLGLVEMRVVKVLVSYVLESGLYASPVRT